MKITNYLEHITGVSIYPVITLLIFFLFFALLALWVVRTGKHQYSKISHLPLDGGELPHESSYPNH